MAGTLKGIAASDGIAIAKAYLMVDPDLSFEKKNITDVDAEIKRLHDALEKSKEELSLIKVYARTCRRYS